MKKLRKRLYQTKSKQKILRICINVIPAYPCSYTYTDYLWKIYTTRINFQSVWSTLDYYRSDHLFFKGPTLSFPAIRYPHLFPRLIVVYKFPVKWDIIYMNRVDISLVLHQIK